MEKYIFHEWRKLKKLNDSKTKLQTEFDQFKILGFYIMGEDSSVLSFVICPPMKLTYSCFVSADICEFVMLKELIAIY